jgi:hypothetical protein
MKTRRRQQKGRGIISSKPTPVRHGITFRSNAKPPNNSIFFPQNDRYLNDLLGQVRRHIPPSTNIPQNNAQIMGALLENYDTPEEMIEMIGLIYDPQPLEPHEADIERRLLTQGRRRAIGRVSQAPLPQELKQRILNRIRYSLAREKIHHMFEKEHVVNPRFIHPEWNESS